MHILTAYLEHYMFNHSSDTLVKRHFGTFSPPQVIEFIDRFEKNIVANTTTVLGWYTLPTKKYTQLHHTPYNLQHLSIHHVPLHHTSCTFAPYTLRMTP